MHLAVQPLILVLLAEPMTPPEAVATVLALAVSLAPAVMPAVPEAFAARHHVMAVMRPQNTRQYLEAMLLGVVQSSETAERRFRRRA